MAHIPDGILSAPVLIGGAVLAAGGIAWGMRCLDDHAIPRAAMLAAAFFAGSLIAVPVGPSSVHLMLTGLMGIMLGPGIFPAVAVALLLQALLFGVGGLTTLGVNIVDMAVPGLLLGLALGPTIRSASAAAAVRTALAAAVGALAVLGTGGLVAASLLLSSSDYTPAASILLTTYFPLALAEAFVTAALVAFLARVHPEALQLATP